MSKDFKKIRSVLARKEVWKEALRLKHHVFIRVQDFFYPGHILTIEKEGVWIVLQVKYMERLQNLLSSQRATDFVGYLNSNQERYYFYGQALSKQNFLLETYEQASIFIRFDTDLFKLDRRSNFRVRLPDKERFPLLITELNGVPIKLNGLVRDISNQGIGFITGGESLNHNWALGDRIRGRIKSEEDKDIVFDGEVKHCSLPNDHTVRVGVMVIEDKMKSSYRLMSLTLLWQKKILQSTP